MHGKVFLALATEQKKRSAQRGRLLSKRPRKRAKPSQVGVQVSEAISNQCRCVGASLLYLIFLTFSSQLGGVQPKMCLEIFSRPVRMTCRMNILFLDLHRPSKWGTPLDVSHPGILNRGGKDTQVKVILAKGTPRKDNGLIRLKDNSKITHPSKLIHPEYPLLDTHSRDWHLHRHKVYRDNQVNLPKIRADNDILLLVTAKHNNLLRVRGRLNLGGILLIPMLLSHPMLSVRHIHPFRASGNNTGKPRHPSQVGNTQLGQIKEDHHPCDLRLPRPMAKKRNLVIPGFILVYQSSRERFKKQKKKISKDQLIKRLAAF